MSLSMIFTRPFTGGIKPAFAWPWCEVVHSLPRRAPARMLQWEIDSHHGNTPGGHRGRREDLHVERHAPALGEAHRGRRIARFGVFQHKAVKARTHHLVALLHIDRKTADIGHEHARPSRNIGADIPGAAGR